MKIDKLHKSIIHRPDVELNTFKIKPLGGILEDFNQTPAPEAESSIPKPKDFTDKVGTVKDKMELAAKIHDTARDNPKVSPESSIKKSPEEFAGKWMPSDKYTLAEIPIKKIDWFGPKGATTDYSKDEPPKTKGPIVVDDNVNEAGRYDGMFGGAPDVCVVDGQHRLHIAREKSFKTILAWVGDKVAERFGVGSITEMIQTDTVKKADPRIARDLDVSSETAGQGIVKLACIKKPTVFAYAKGGLDNPEAPRYLMEPYMLWTEDGRWLAAAPAVIIGICFPEEPDNSRLVSWLRLGARDLNKQSEAFSSNFTYSKDGSGFQVSRDGVQDMFESLSIEGVIAPLMKGILFRNLRVEGATDSYLPVLLSYMLESSFIENPPLDEIVKSNTAAIQQDYSHNVGLKRYSKKHVSQYKPSQEGV